MVMMVTAIEYLPIVSIGPQLVKLVRITSEFLFKKQNENEIKIL